MCLLEKISGSTEEGKKDSISSEELNLELRKRNWNTCRKGDSEKGEKCYNDVIK